ncbi:MAG: low molecular weight phosphotyrosine protein phosphatase [Microscillaceae bacterium]|jgi:protein-tyrosine phosphatase|nr:low molecular weight phosphotyrosine protein phosphatase [Microscillaceae bacterium]
MIKVLFVCLGNICRSPMAEGVFRELTKDEDDKFYCDSAGTSTYHIGELPDERMQTTAQKHSINLTHRARQISRDDFDKFDYIIAMDKSNYQNILNLKSRVNNAAETHIMLMRSFDTSKDNLDVPDPYYGSMKDFEEVYEILQRCNQNFINFLQEEYFKS